MRRAAIMLALVLMGCASYTPVPLDAGGDVLAPPDLSTLLVKVGSTDRPYLKPVNIDLSAPLDGNAVATIAVLANPELRAARMRAGVNDAQVFSAKLLPDPTLSLGVSKVLAGPDPFLDLVGALGLDINAIRTRRVLMAQTKAAADQVRLDLAWSEWQTAGQARLQAVRVIQLTRALEIANLERTTARSLLARYQHAAARGDVAGDQVQAARLGAADAEAKVHTGERDLDTARLELVKLMGLPPQTQLRLEPETVANLLLDSAKLFAVAAANRTDIRALQAGYDSQEAAVHKTVLDQFPNLGLTINANRDTGGNLLIGPAIDFTLPLWNRNRGGIAVENATRAALKAEYEARLFQARAEIAAAVSGIEVSRRQRDAAFRDLPMAREYAEANHRAAARGDISRAAAEAAEQALYDKETLLAQSDQAIAEQMIALELLTGTLREAWTQ